MENFFEDDTLLARWLSGEVSDAERQAIEQHPDFPVWQRIVAGADRLLMPDAGVQQLWDRLSPRLGTKPRKSARSSRIQWIRWSAGLAAAIALAVFAWTLWYTTPSAPAIVATATGEQKTTTLPDGSTVRLNAVSSVELYVRNWRNERRVRLVGEGFFSVKKSQAPFVVETAAGTVTVLGTSFTVRYRGSSFDVACYEGFVQAATTTGAKQALLAGQKASARNNRWQPLSEITDSWPAWMQGESRFSDAPVYEVLAELQRQYNIEIKATGTEGKRFSGPFVHGDLPLALRMVCGPLGLTYTIDGKKVRIGPPE